MDGYVYDLQDYKRVARERWRTIALTTLVVLAAAIVVSSAPITEPPREADPTVVDSETRLPDTAMIVVRIYPPPPILGGKPSIEAERLIALSNEVLRPAAEDLHLGIDQLTNALAISAFAEAESLAVSATDIDGAAGEEVARSVASSYLRHRSASMQTRLGRALDRATDQLRASREQVRENESLLATLRVAALESEVARLRSAVLSAEPGEIFESGAYELLIEPISSPGTQSRGSARERAIEPERGQDAPGRLWVRNLIAGLLLGVILGYGLALLLDILTRRFRSPREVRERLALPILARVRRHDEAAAGAISPHIENALRERDHASLAWVEIGGQGSRELFDGVMKRLRVGGSDVEAIEPPKEASATSRTQAERTLRNVSSIHNAILVRTPPDAPAGTSLAWAGAAETAIVMIDLHDVTRDDAEQEIGNLRRAGTEIVGLLLLI